MELRPDLTAAQIASVRQQLQDAGLLDAFPNGMDGRALLRFQDRNDDQDAPPTTGDVPPTDRRASDSRGKSNRRGRVRRGETTDTLASGSPHDGQGNVRPSNSDEKCRPDENCGVAERRAAVQPQQPLLDARAKETAQLRRERSSPPSQESNERPASSASRDARRQSSREQRGSLRDSSGDSSTSSGKTSSRIVDRDLDSGDDIADTFPQTVWAYYILPQSVLTFYRPSLCGSCYTCHSMMVLRAIRRVLRDDGVVWWNLGDGYYASGPNRQTGLGSYGEGLKQDKRSPYQRSTDGLKPKDLILMPERIALAAQAEGWWVRSRIIWNKSNAMPESDDSRPTNSHETIWMMTKNAAKPLYWILSSTGEISDVAPRKRGRWIEGVDWDWVTRSNGKRVQLTHWQGKDYWWDQEVVREAHGSIDRIGGREPNFAPHKHLPEDQDYNRNRAGGDGVGYSPAGRNIRNVWTFSTAQTPEAHFATFPEELPRRCILAACPRKVCRTCGKARVRIVERQGLEEHPARANRNVRNKADFDGEGYAERESTLGLVGDDVTTGWTDCGHNTYQPGVVLDPFCGLATTGIVAKRLGRRFIGIELSEKYAEMARNKLTVGRKMRSDVTREKSKGEQEREKRGLGRTPLI